jgi:hypothetical protein
MTLTSLTPQAHHPSDCVAIYSGKAQVEIGRLRTSEPAFGKNETSLE